MPRYFFNLFSEEQISFDDDGVQLKDLSSAHEYGLRLQRQLRHYVMEDESGWTIKVTDDVGRMVLAILPQPTYTDAFPYYRGR